VVSCGHERQAEARGGETGMCEIPVKLSSMLEMRLGTKRRDGRVLPRSDQG
jgi:hypothetical protein